MKDKEAKQPLIIGDVVYLKSDLQKKNPMTITDIESKEDYLTKEVSFICYCSWQTSGKIAKQHRYNANCLIKL